MRSVTGRLGQVGDAIAAALTQESKLRRVYALPEKLRTYKKRELIEVLNPGFSAGVCQRLRLPGGNINQAFDRRDFYITGHGAISSSLHSPTVPNVYLTRLVFGDV